MDNSRFDDFSMTLIHQAEDECAARDPGMVPSAAMVLVGDVYAILVCRGDSLPLPLPLPLSRQRDNGLAPFIR